MHKRRDAYKYIILYLGVTFLFVLRVKFFFCVLRVTFFFFVCWLCRSELRLDWGEASGGGQVPDAAPFLRATF